MPISAKQGQSLRAQRSNPCFKLFRIASRSFAMTSALLLSLLSLSAPPAHSAACCTSATAFGTGRLLVWETWAAGMRTNFNHEVGFYDDRGVFEASEDGSYDQQLRFDAYTLVRTSDNGALFLVVPWVFPRVGDSEGGAIGYGLSDIQIGYRHQLIAIGEYEELPSLALSGAVLIPTGTPRQLGVAAHEVTGRDALALMAGASLEKTWMPVFVQLNLGASLLFNHIRTGNQTPDPIVPSFQVSLASGVEITDSIVASLMSTWTYEMPAKWKTEVGASASWRFTPHLTAQLSFNTNVFMNGSGLNWPANVSYGAGIRYGYF